MTEIVVAPVIIEINVSGPDIIEVVVTPAPSVEIAAQLVGVQGPPGTNGSAGARYVHVQASAATLWTVAHNLGFRPVVAIYTVGGLQVEGGEVLHLSTLTLTITFDVAFAGSAALV